MPLFQDFIKKRETFSVKVRAYKKLGPTGKVEDVDAHMRKVKSAATKLATKILKSKDCNNISTNHHFTIIIFQQGCNQSNAQFP